MIVNKYAPMHKKSRNEKKLQEKPWLFAGLIKCIKYKNNMFY